MAQVIEGDVDAGLAAMTRYSEAARAAGLEETGVTGYRNVAVLAMRAMDYDAAGRALDVGMVYADSIQQSHCA